MILLILIILTIIYRNTKPFPVILKVTWGAVGMVYGIIGILWFITLLGETIA